MDPGAGAPSVPAPKAEGCADADVAGAPKAEAPKAEGAAVFEAVVDPKSEVEAPVVAAGFTPKAEVPVEGVDPKLNAEGVAEVVEPKREGAAVEGLDAVDPKEKPPG